MKHLVTRRYRLSLGMVLAFLLLAILVACGPGEEPTPVPTPTQGAAATPTQAAAVATPTPTRAAAVATPTPTRPAVVATPTPTTVAIPSSPTPTPGVQPKRGGTLKYVDVAYVPDFNIYVTANGGNPSGTRWYAKLHNNLLVNYVDSNVECEVCSEWHLENQGKTMVFTLIPGIKFQDGREMTAADVKYSLRMIMGDVDGILSPRGGVLKEFVASIETPSKYELRINLLRPSLFVPTLLSIEVMMIVPDGTTRAALQTNYYGSGPFVLKQKVAGASWSMERNPNYFKQGQPYIDKIEIIVVPDQNTRVAATMTGSSDYFLGPPGAPPPQYRPQLYKLRDEGKLVLIQWPLYCGHQGIFFSQAKPPFSNLKLRQALNLALDRKIIGEVAYGDLAVVNLMGQAEGMYYGQLEKDVWNVVPGWGTGAKKQQEIEQAKQLVKDAGYPNGIDVPQMVIGVITADSKHETEQQMLGVVGIRTKLDILDSATGLDRMSKLDYAFTDYGQCVPTLDPDEAVGTYYLAASSRNWYGYSNPKIDQLYLQMSSELDPPKRRELFLQIGKILIVDEVANAPTMGTKAMIALQARVQGFTGSISTVHSASGFERADRLWLK